MSIGFASKAEERRYQAIMAPISKSLIFVYGSLMKGFGNHTLMKDATFIKEGLTLPNYTLISLGSFPGVLPDGTTSVKGEVYEVDLKTRDRLDQLEGHPNWYVRTPITLVDGTEVEIYLYPNHLGSGRPVIESGNWRSQ